MAIQLGPSFCVILTIGVFFLCLLTFAGVPKTELPQDKSRLFGYPVWHPPIKRNDYNKTDSSLAFGSLLIIITVYLASRWTAHPPTIRKLQTYFISGDSPPVSAYYFNRLLVLYAFNTVLTFFAILIFDVGKLWVGAIGMLHNSSEFAVLVLIGSGGRIKNISFYAILLSYMFFVYCGLCFDYALMITFTRIYINTSHELKHGDENELFASVFHNVGNLTATVSFDTLVPSILTSLTYAITYPAYMYYVYVDTHATSVYPTKRIYLPSTPGWKKFVIGMISLCCSLLTVRLGAFLMNRENHNDD
ncbi:14499_t:CDS:2, partial [Dentiscutata erythropus]